MSVTHHEYDVVVIGARVAGSVLASLLGDRPEDFPFNMCVRRITLDDILVRRVRTTPNVELREEAVVHTLLSEHGRISGVAWKASGTEQQASAKVVVGADGVRSFVAKEVGAEIEQEEPVRRAMYYAYFRGIEANDPCCLGKARPQLNCPYFNPMVRHEDHADHCFRSHRDSSVVLLAERCLKNLSPSRQT